MVSDKKIISNVYRSVEYKGNENPRDLIGKRVGFANQSNSKVVRLALICNWGQQCGISTYSNYLVDALYPKLKAEGDELKIFSEKNNSPRPGCNSDGYNIEYCWKRGESLLDLAVKIIQWKPTVVLISHEFGIFPKGKFFLQLFEKLKQNNIPVVTTLHSVYEHLDKSICTAAMENIIVHSEAGKDCLINKLGHTNKNIYIINHGCTYNSDIKPNFNFFGGPSIFQFGFGFNYKNVDGALEAISKIKNKIPNIFYCVICSENSNTKNINNNYYKMIQKKVEELGLQDNVSIQRGFYSDEEINNYIRTSRVCIFPYKSDPNNIVYGASGAIRIAMSNGTPCIASQSKMFIDLDGVLPRPSNSEELAQEIQKVLLNNNYRDEIIKKQQTYVKNNTWEVISDKYLETLKQAVHKYNTEYI